MTKLQHALKTFRSEHNMTQLDLGKQLGVSKQTISRWENAACIPSPQMQHEICKLLNISPDELIDTDESNHDNIPAASQQYLRMPVGLNVMFLNVHDFSSFTQFLDAAWHSYFMLSGKSDDSSVFATFYINPDKEEEPPLTIESLYDFDEKKVRFSVAGDYVLTLEADKIGSIQPDATYHNQLYAFRIQYKADKNPLEFQLIFAVR